MQLTTRSLNHSFSLQFLSIFLSVDCRKADYFRQIYSQLSVFSINLKELQTERIIPVSGGILQGDFFTGTPPKSSEYRKVYLGKVRKIYVNVDSPNLGFPYF